MIETLKTRIPKRLHIPLIFALSRLYFLTIIYLQGHTFSSVCGMFDGKYYREIAEFGYNLKSAAFFPVVPICISLAGDIGAVLINNLAFLISMYLLYQLMEEDICGIVVYALSPIALFTMLEYTESLFLLFTILASTLLIKRKFGIIMGCCVGLCVCTRGVGAALFFAVFVGMVLLLYKREIQISDIIKTYIPATVISCLYPIYLHIMFGNWKLFIDSQYQAWHKIKTTPIQTLLAQIETIKSGHHSGYKWGTVGYDGIYKNWSAVSEIVVIIIGFAFICLLIYVLKHKHLDIDTITMITYVVMAVCIINSLRCATTTDVTTVSYIRYYLSLFPCYIALSMCPNKVKYCSIVCFGLLSILTTLYFLKGIAFF